MTDLPISTRDTVRYDTLDDTIDFVAALAAGKSGKEAAAAAEVLETLKKKRGEPDRPVYILAVPDLLQRAGFRREVRRTGADYPGEAALYKALRADLTVLAPANLDTLLQLVDEVEAATRGGPAAPPEALEMLEGAMGVARALGGRFAAVEADRGFWMSVAPLIACRMFLLGWENRQSPFQRTGGRTADQCLRTLPEADLTAVGNKIMSLMTVGEETAGNSASPSPSHSGPANSTKSGKPRRTAGRAGASAGKSTKRTRASS